jgi:hypothetical protein
MGTDERSPVFRRRSDARRGSSSGFFVVSSFHLREENQFSFGNGHLGCVSDHLRTFSWHIPRKSADRHADDRNVLIGNFPSRAKVSRGNHDIDSLIRFEQNAGCRVKYQYQRQKHSRPLHDRLPFKATLYWVYNAIPSVSRVQFPGPLLRITGPACFDCTKETLNA